MDQPELDKLILRLKEERLFGRANGGGLDAARKPGVDLLLAIHTLDWSVETLLEKLTELSKKPAQSFRTAERNHVPEQNGVYVIFEADRCIYVGRSRNLRRRLLGDHRVGGNSQFRYDVGLYRGLVPTHEPKDAYRTNQEYKEDITGYVWSRCSFVFSAIEPSQRTSEFENIARWALQPEFNPWP